MIVIFSLLYFLLGLSLMSIGLGFARWELNNLFRRPISLVYIGLGFIHGIQPAIQMQLGIYRYSESGYSFQTNFYSMLLTAMFAGVFYFAYYGLIESQPKGRCHKCLRAFTSGGKAFVCLTMAIPGSLAMGLLFRRIQSFGYENYIRDRINFSDQYGGVLTHQIKWVHIAFLLYLTHCLCSRKKDWRSLFLAIVTIVMTVVYYSFTTARNTLFIVLIVSIGIHLMTSKKRISIQKFVGSKGVVLLILSLVGFYLITEYRYKSMGSDGDGNSYYNALNGSFGNHENVLWLLENDTQIQYGATYFSGLVVCVPRRIWPEKPLGAGPRLKNMIYPGSYKLGEKGTSSLTTGYLTEAYMNGREIGIAIIALMAGISLRFLSRLSEKPNGPFSMVLLTYTIYMFSLFLIFGEFLGVVGRWLTEMLLVIVGYLLFEMHLGKKSSTCGSRLIRNRKYER